MPATLSAFLSDPAVRSARKLLITPTVQAGVALRAALALRDSGVAGLDVATVRTTARRLVSWRHPERGGAVLGAATLGIEVACMLHGMNERASTVRSARAVARSIAEARAAGLDARAYGRRAVGELGRIATSVFRQLERELERSGRYDDARMLERATAIAAEAPDHVLPSVLLVMDEVDLTGRALELVRAIGSRANVFRRVGPPSAPFAPPPFTAAERLDVPMLSTEVPTAPAEIRFVDAVGVEAEIRSVVRGLADAGTPFDEVELAYPGHEPYLAVIRDVFEQAGVAATYAAGVALSDTVPGRSVRGWLQWVAEGQPGRLLGDLLRTGTIALDGDVVGRPLARDVTRALDSMRPGAGAEPIRSTARRVMGPAAFEALDALLELAPARDVCTPKDLATSLRAVVLGFSPDAVGDDPERARGETLTRIRELGDATGQAPTRALALQFTAALDGVFIQARAARPGHVHVVPLSGAGHTGRPQFFIVGLDHDSFRHAVGEDSLIPDHRRTDPDGPSSLPVSTVWRLRPRWWLERCIARTRGRVTLVRSTYDLAGDRELYASATWLDLRRRYPDAAIERHTYRPALGDGAPGLPVTLAEGLLAARRDPDARRHVETRHAWMERGREAAERASSDRWTAFDGYVGVARSPWSPSEPVSPSRLETLAACPFRYFLRYELGVHPPDRVDDTTWMDARERGSIVHEAFRAYVQAWIDNGAPPPREALFAAMDRELEAFARTHRPPGRTAEFRVRSEMDAAAAVLLDDVARAVSEGREPVAVEWGFGAVDDRADGEAAEPFVLALEGLDVPLRGVVDRIDRHADGTLAVVDYKTGRADRFRGADLGAGGRLLQWALYARAVEDLRGERVSRSGYLFVGSRETGLRLLEPPPDPDALAERLRGLTALPGLGLFPQSAGTDECGRCDFVRVCGDLDARKEAVAAKVAATDPDSDTARALEGWIHSPGSK